MNDQHFKKRTARAQLSAALALAVIVLIAALVAGCERNSRIVADEQIRDSQDPCPKGCEILVPGCAIKGVVSPTGEKRFVTPDNQFYQALAVDPDRDERWFCTEEDAINNGFSRSRQPDEAPTEAP